MSAKPNIVIIMTDQQRASVCAREGFALDTTPYLDELAAGGVWFDRAYTASPTCLPARQVPTRRWRGLRATPAAVPRALTKEGGTR